MAEIKISSLVRNNNVEDDVLFIGSWRSGEHYATYSTNAKDLEKYILSKLQAGEGISISNEDDTYIISSNIDTTLFEVVTELPENPTNNRIYLLAKTDVTDDQDKYDEYIYNVDESRWELLGTREADVNLDNYYDKDTIDSQIKDLSDRITSNTTDLGRLSSTFDSTFENLNVSEEHDDNDFVKSVEQVDGKISVEYGKILASQISVGDDEEPTNLEDKLSKIDEKITEITTSSLSIKAGNGIEIVPGEETEISVKISGEGIKFEDGKLCLDTENLSETIAEQATSIAQDVANEVKKSILTGGANEEIDEAYDTLLEISKWIKEHSETGAIDDVTNLTKVLRSFLTDASEDSVKAAIDSKSTVTIESGSGNTATITVDDNDPVTVLTSVNTEDLESALSSTLNRIESLEKKLEYYDKRFGYVAPSESNSKPTWQVEFLRVDDNEYSQE